MISLVLNKTVIAYQIQQATWFLPVVADSQRECDTMSQGEKNMQIHLYVYS